MHETIINRPDLGGTNVAREKDLRAILAHMTSKKRKKDEDEEEEEASKPVAKKPRKHLQSPARRRRRLDEVWTSHHPLCALTWNATQEDDIKCDKVHHTHPRHTRCLPVSSLH